MRRVILFVILGYLSGSVLYANVFGKIFKKENILEESCDHNPGAANAFQYGGFWCGLLTLCCDLLKGFFPVFLFSRQTPAEGAEFAMAFVLAAPVLGHVFPAFSRFQGGKGITTTFGCLLGLVPNGLPSLLLAAFFILFSVVVRISPHFYRTLAAYFCALLAMPVFGVDPGICVGFFIITAAVSLRFHLSREEREDVRVGLLWMR